MEPAELVPLPIISSLSLLISLQVMELLFHSPRNLWSVYGVYDWLPRTARLRHCTLLPGKSELIFAVPGGRSTVGSYSLADRLLANRSLKAWAIATIPFLRGNREGRWEKAVNHASFRHEIRVWRPFPRVFFYAYGHLAA